MRDRSLRRLAGITALSTAAALVLARSARPVAELLEGLGFIDPYRTTTSDQLRSYDVDTLARRVAQLEERLAIVEARWEEFDRNWPEPYRHAAAAASFDRLGGAQ